MVRIEKKYILPLEAAARLEGRLQALLPQDVHNGRHGYVNRSLYFDTPWDRDLHQKRDSIEQRRKLRLRCYGDGGDSARLEIKQKDGERQQKRFVWLPRRDAQLLCQGNYEPLLRLGDPFALECYALLSLYAYRPKAIVQYTRRAFVAPQNDIRLTFDSQVTATQSSTRLFDTPLPTYPVLSYGAVIFEVKYRGFLPSWVRDQLAGIDQSELSVSKYALARGFFCPTH